MLASTGWAADGAHGAFGVRRICEAFAAGDLDRDGWAAALVRFPWHPTCSCAVAEISGVACHVPGSWDDVVAAVDDGLIDLDDYRALLAAVTAG